MLRFITLLCLVVSVLCSVCTAEPAAKRAEFLLGVDANYSLEMEAAGASWKWGGRQQDLFTGMAGQGPRDLRVRLWTGETGKNGKQYATKVVERSRRAGLNPYLVLFLSEDWADLEKQPAPKMWQSLNLEARAEAISQYSEKTVRHFQRHGLQSHLYEVGNEIDYGICGVYPAPGEGTDPASLKKRVWPQAAQLIKACQSGVEKADPKAKFMLHIAHWWDREFCLSFFRFMLEQGVQIDYAGLSYFPSSNIGGSLKLEQFDGVVSALHQDIDRPIIIAETGYPATPHFQGQFAGWKNEVPGYPLTPEGQQRWLAAFIRYCTGNPKIAGFFYWSPEWCGDGLWHAFSLFGPDGEARPAWRAFRPNTDQG